MATMDIFSSSVNPKSFQMHRRSSLATKLKTNVTEKLIQFLDDKYTVDVLAEYIVVLVCNGKHQNQAKKELEAFLGHKSGEFVSWLWDILSKTVHQSRMSNDLSNSKAVILESDSGDAVENYQRISRLWDLQNPSIKRTDTLLSKEEKFYLSTSPRKPISSMNDEVYEFCQPFRPEFDSSMDDNHGKLLHLEKYASEGSKKFGSGEFICNETMKHGSSRVKWSSEVLTGDDQVMQYVDQRKIDNSNCLSRQLLQSPKREMVSRKLPSVRKENPQPRPIPVTKSAETRLSSNSASQRNARPHGNVWDRLGKPCDDNSIMRRSSIEVPSVKRNRIEALSVRRSKIEVPSVDGTIRKLLAHDEGFVQRRLMPCVPVGKHIRRSMEEVPAYDNSMNIVIPDYRDDFKQLCRLSDVHSPYEEIYSSRKRQFGEIDPGDASRSASLADNNYKRFQEKETLEVNTPSSTQCTGSLGLNNVAAETRKSDVTGALCAFRSPDIAPNLKNGNVSQSKLIREASEVTPQVLVSDSSPLVTKLESFNNEMCEHTSLKPEKSEMLGPEFGLLQNKLEVSKLCSKKIVMSNGDQADSLTSSGALSIPEEDSQSRTVFVTNVPFDAAKESLSSHFARCGLVANIIMLTDPFTGRPRGSAYITFASKDSVEKAVRLSGSSFWSRILKVVRKSEMQAVTVKPAHQAQTCFPQSNRIASLRRPYTGSNLQWRRDQQVNTSHSISTRASGGLEASLTAEQDAIDSNAQVLPRSLTYVRST